MTFWSSATLEAQIPAENLIEPYSEENVKHCAYELEMGAEAFITSTADKVKIELDNNDSMIIPPGQFALLLTKERVKVPLNAICFISHAIQV